MIRTSVITQKGQITIPQSIRQKLALKRGSRVTFFLDEDVIKVAPLPSFFDFRGSIKLKKEFDIKKMREAAKKQLADSYGKNY